MPAPSAADINAIITAGMGSVPGHAHLTQFIQALSAEMNTRWESWRAGSTWGGLTIANFVGAGGSVSAPGFTLDPDAVIAAAGFKAPPALQKFISTLATVMAARFATWAGSYVFAGVVYSGTNAPIALASAGSGTNPAGTQSAWEALLVVAPDPVFNLDHPLCKSRLMTQAVSQAFESLFVSKFLANTLAEDNTGGESGTSGASDGKFV